VTSCQQAGLLLGELPGDCNCPEHTTGTPTWNGVEWDPSTCIAKFCPKLSVDYGGVIVYTASPEGPLLGKRQHGSVAFISCPKGHLISRSTTRSTTRLCVEGEWQGEPQNCYPVFKPKSIHEIYNGVELCFIKKFSDCDQGPPYGPIETWDVSQVKVTRSLFDNAFYIEQKDRLLNDDDDLDYFADLDGVTKGNVSMWNVSMVADMRNMFSNTRKFNGDISRWDVSRVDEMRSMFSTTGAFNADISKWDVSKVTDMERMFEDAEKFNADISKWHVSKVTSMERMFRSTYAFSRTLCGYWKSSKARKDQMLYRSNGKMC